MGAPVMGICGFETVCAAGVLKLETFAAGALC